VFNAIGVHLCPKLLGHKVNIVVLEVLGYPRNEGCANSQPKKESDPLKELLRRVFIELLSKKIKVIQKKIVGETTALAGTTTESLKTSGLWLLKRGQGL